MNDKQLGIYISSYDGCSDLWDTFFMLFDRFWPDCKYPVYLINNVLPYQHENITVVNTGQEIHWFYRTLVSLKQLKEKYILFMLEDYFISKIVNNGDIAEILDFMEANEAYYYQLSVGCTGSKEPCRVNVTAETEYPISLQPAIWNRQRLIKLLEDINGKTPWDVEYYLVNAFRDKKGSIKGAYHDTRDILGYKNGVLRGKWIPSTIKYYKKTGIDIYTGNRQVMSSGKMLKYLTATFVQKHVPKRIKAIGKSILKAVNFDYLK